MGHDGRVTQGFGSRLQMLVWSIQSIALAAACLVLFVLTTAGAGLITVWVGIPMLIVAIGQARRLAEHRRTWIAPILGQSLDSAYLRAPEGGMLARIGVLAADPAVRRDMLWIFIDGTLGLTLSIVAVVESLLGLVFWWLPPSLAVRAHAQLDQALLAPSEKSRLAVRVEQLTESRAETVDIQATELRRIERDLHDGAQARLVALGMNLAMAEQELARNPDSARTLLIDARTASSEALAELRDLVRGIHPPVLADRGLVGAVQALGLAASIPVEVRVEIDGRLPAPVESATYFAVAEVLTNVIKHAGAQHAWISVSHTADVLTASVRDDGAGGADPGGGTGLRGIERRLSAFDGTLTITSPVGRGTEVVMVLPCASSLPKTSPSSGTG
jgi:signal transduction histidine kinase